MTLYFIGFDVSRGDSAELENPLNRWREVLAYQGAWLLKTKLSALDIRNALQSHLRDDDPALILELKPGSWRASERVERPSLEWLKANILE